MHAGKTKVGNNRDYDVYTKIKIKYEKKIITYREIFKIHPHIKKKNKPI